jgi:hypothetical protein
MIYNITAGPASPKQPNPGDGRDRSAGDDGASTLVNKIVAYDKPGATWKNSALLVAGAGDSSDPFESYTAAVQAQLLSQGMTVTKILQGSDPTAAADFLAAFNSGQGLVNYVGHGSVEVWQADMFTSAVAGTVTNGPKTPLVLSMTCLNGYFLASTTFSLAEALMQGPGGEEGRQRHGCAADVDHVWGSGDEGQIIW